MKLRRKTLHEKRKDLVIALWMQHYLGIKGEKRRLAHMAPLVERIEKLKKQSRK